ncbi:TIGR01777 family oxidoreductase [Mesobacillus foraminis]|uniref:TIGR01777 family oxidoreductase n=1 Tax=Mesobacillus foraminis TaxID=279826 RepID=UPI000EF49BD0|nr:TIGR01777 family oxidoreductase [Mesobacillus foraminis]
MKIAIAGGTGFIGKALTSLLIDNGYEVIILSRRDESIKPSANPRTVRWLNDGDQPELHLEGVQAFVNLAGTTINSRWNPKSKAEIVSSRISAVNEIRRIIQNLPKKPRVVVNASAVGFYGTSETKTFTETSHSVGNDFLAETVKKWEEEVLQIEQAGVRTVLCRFGVILDKNQGALSKMLLPYRLYAGGTIGSGKQWLSWVHIDDVARGILFAIEEDSLSGPVNFTAPEPVRMEQFGRQLAHSLNRPHWLRVPSFGLQLLLGEMSMLVLEGQRVLPEKLLDYGFIFFYPNLKDAMTDLFQD